MTHNPRTAGDERRALALIQHHHACDYDGLDTVLREAVDTGRVGQLVVTLFWKKRTTSAAAVRQAWPRCDQRAALRPGKRCGPGPGDGCDRFDSRRSAPRGTTRLGARRPRRQRRSMKSFSSSPPSQKRLWGVMSLMSVLVPVLDFRTAIDLLREAALRAAGLEAEDE